MNAPPEPNHAAPTPPGLDTTPAQQRLDAALSFLGHDVREGHSSTLALLELQRIKSDPMSMPELIERIERHARRSLAAIDDFMDIARARSQPLLIEEVDLGELLLEIVADAWSAAQHSGVRVQVTAAPESAIGEADRELLHNALTKLLRDVIARSPSGFELRCALHTDGTHWIVEIGDPAGAAIEADTSSKAAARRERAEPGMTLCRVVAERHGGRLQIEPHADQGRAIQLHIPQIIARFDADP